MTLTEMLEQQSNHRPLTVGIVKDVFKEWLEEISLGATQDRAMYDLNISHDLIIMVDDSSYFENEHFERGT